MAVLIFAALLAPALALILTTQGEVVSSPISVAEENSPDNSPTNVFGNPDLPDWKDVTVEDTADFIIVNNADNLIFKFRKGTAGYNEIWQNDVQIVADERWVIEYLFNAPDTWKTRGLPQYVEWEQPENYHVVVKRYYRDWGEPETTFWVVYDFHGGFRPKISVEMEVGQEDNYRIAWKASGINKTHVENLTNCVRFWDEGEEAIVFDYSDVYETFGDITEVEIEPWANDHKLNEYFYVGELGVGDFTLDPNFGYEGEGTFFQAPLESYVRGTKATCPETGTADSIIAHLEVTDAAKKVKCALYKVSDDSFVAETEEKTVPVQAFTWVTFNFSDPKPSLESIDYYIVAFGEAGDGATNMSHTTTAGSYKRVARSGLSYPTWPDPSGVTEYDGATSIYCTYTPSAAEPGKPVLISPENQHSTSDNTPTFAWENGSDATSHRLVIDNSQDFDDGENIYDNASAWDNSGTAIENELPVDNYWWKVAGVANSTENWSENTWTFEVVAGAWGLIETWTGTVQAPVAWELMETWDGIVKAFVSWQLIESWGGTIQAPAGWQLAESWTGTILAPAEWSEVESWTGTVYAVGWRLIETWGGTVHGVGWRLIETWTGSLETPAVYAVIVSITPDNQSGTLGDTLTFTVTVINIGGTIDNYDLTSSDAQGWTTYLDNDNFLNVPSGENRETILNVGLSTTGMHEVIVTATGTGVSDSDNCTAISATAPEVVQIGDADLALAIGLMAVGLALCAPFIALILIRRRREEEGEI